MLIRANDPLQIAEFCELASAQEYNKTQRKPCIKAGWAYLGSPSALGITCGNGWRGKVQIRCETPSKINKKSSGQEEISTRLLNLWGRRSNSHRREQDSSSPVGFAVVSVSEVITHLIFTPLKLHSTLLLIRPSSPWRSTRKTPRQIFGPT